MYELIQAGGWLIWPIILCSIIAMAITVERLWTYRRKRVVPDYLLGEIWQLHKKGELSVSHSQSFKED